MKYQSQLDQTKTIEASNQSSEEQLKKLLVTLWNPPGELRQLPDLRNEKGNPCNDTAFAPWGA
jgi:hypothetical protein